MAARHDIAGDRESADEARRAAAAIRGLNDVLEALAAEEVFMKSRRQSARAAGSFGPRVTSGMLGAKPFTKGPESVRVGGSSSWRNNNPGNLRYGSHAIRHGAIGQDGHFAVFPHMDAGHTALVNLFHRNDYQRMRLSDAMYLYLQDLDISREMYLQQLWLQTGMDPNLPVNSLNQAQLDQLAFAIRDLEGHEEGDQYLANDPNVPPVVVNIFHDEVPVMPGPPPVVTDFYEAAGEIAQEASNEADFVAVFDAPPVVSPGDDS